MDKKLKPGLAWLLFLLLALTWGSSFIIMKRALGSFDYLQIGLIRIATAWIFTLLIAFPRFKNFRQPYLMPLIGVGLFGNAIPYLLFPFAIRYLDSSLVGILNSMVPLFTLVIGIIWFGTKVRWPGITGITLGFIGAVWLLMPDVKIDTANLFYGIFPILATVCYAISINVINARLQNLSAIGITLMSLSAVGPGCLLALLDTDFLTIMQEDPAAWRNFGLLSILGVVGSSLAILVFNILIKQTSSLFAASVTYVIPVVALLWGLYDGETIGIMHLFGMLIIIAGVYLVNFGRQSRQNKKRMHKQDHN